MHVKWALLLCFVGSVAAGGERLQPEDLEYRGAFRLPDGPEEFAWMYSGEGLAYYPDGDKGGPGDGYPGSLFGVGHNWNQYVSEIAIPVPVVSAAKNLDELNTATTLQAFANIRGELYAEMEMPRAGLAILPQMPGQAAAKLYFSFAQHLEDQPGKPAFGWCELTLSTPKPAGPWRIDGLGNYLTSDYLLPLPRAWAKKHAGGRCLGAGRYRDGGQGGQGPSLFAVAPWQDGKPPPANAELAMTTLLRYPAVTAAEPHAMKNYHHSDDWSGAAWVIAGGKSALLFLGTKGAGKCWYGYANGLVWPEEPPYPKVPEYPFQDRGWWSSRMFAQILFYDTADLEKVAAGKMRPREPQPYATLDIEPFLYRQRERLEMRHLGAAAFDRARGILYVVEFRGDEDKSLVHVWQVKG